MQRRNELKLAVQIQEEVHRYMNIIKLREENKTKKRMLLESQVLNLITVNEHMKLLDIHFN